MIGLSGHFDTPGSWTQTEGTIRFSGWCSHPAHRITKLRLSVGEHAVDCRYGLGRPDVEEAYPDWPYSRYSGFETVVEASTGCWNIALHAQLETGETLTLAPASQLTVERLPFPPHLKAVARDLLRFARLLRQKVPAYYRDQGGHLPPVRALPALMRRVAEMYRQRHWIAPETAPHREHTLPAALEPYEAWLRVNRPNERSLAILKQRLAARPHQLPKISVVMPVFDPPVRFLDRAIETVLCQVYGNWELCIADDQSRNPDVRAVLQRWAGGDARIHIVFRDQNGHISRATNDAAALASGEFLLFLDHDDELTPDALAEAALYLADHPDTDFLYSDDDKIDADGNRFAPQFKPDYSPELLLSYMYMSHLCVIRRSLFDQVGGLRVGFEGSQDYDLALRATEKAVRVGHLPLILYHWRVLPGSTAHSGGEKPSSFEAGRRAVAEALERRGVNASVSRPQWAVQGNLGIFSHEFPDTGPSVAIVIPTKNQLPLLKACLEALQKTTYRNYQVVIVDNESDDPETLDYLGSIPHTVLRIPNPNGRFNFAAINNRAAECVDSEYVLFLNNDTEIISPRWLSQMMGYAQLPGVGAVGARLLYSDGRIQHAGIVHGLYHGMAGPALKLLPDWDHGYLSYAKVVRNYSAVTAACLLTPRRLFLDLKGFDEGQFGVAYNDVDYCYRLVDGGYRCVYCPDAELVHREGSSRGFADNPQELATFRRKYADHVDPWYSPHLSLADEHFRIQPRKVIRGALPALRTLMCAFNLNPEGAPYSQFELTRELKSRGVIDPIVYCPEDGPLRADYEEHGIEVRIERHPLSGVSTQAEYDRRIDEFAGFMRQLGVGLVYGNTRQTFYAIDAAHRAQLPSIWNPRESEPWQTYFDQFGRKIAQRAIACFQYPYRVIFVADATRDTCRELNTHHNFTVIHNGLDVARVRDAAANWPRDRAREDLAVEAEEIVILLLGTVCERKGQHDLPQALAQLPPELHDRIRCFIVGDRPSAYSHELRALVSRLPERLQRRVQIVPETHEAPKFYQAADIFVCSSRIESYPRVILEAMAYGLPIITTPVYGISEQVQDGINGLFYDPGNTAHLAEHLRVLIGAAELRRRLALNGTYVLDALNTFDDMVAAYAEVFKEAYASSQLNVDEQ